MYSDPLAYLITFTVRGTWLRGDERGSFSRSEGFLAPSPERVRRDSSLLQSPPRLLTPDERAAVDAAFRELCAARSWRLYASNVRSNHSHLVVGFQNVEPGRVAAQLKAKATRRLRRTQNWPESQRVWTEKGCEKPLFNEKEIADAVRYVLNQ